MKEERAFKDAITIHEETRYAALESQKPVYRHSAVRMAVLVHGPPLLISVALMTLYYIKPFWFEQTDTFVLDQSFIPFQLHFNTVILLIQLSAKLYEILVVWSISHMALFISRNLLLSTDGIPLSLLTGGHHVGHLGYLISKRFKAFIFRPHLLSSKATYLGLFLVLATFLALSIGPSAATLLIPQLGWHDLPSPFSNVVMPLANVVDKSLVWPLSVNNSFVPTEFTCNLSNYSMFCPGAGLPVVLNWVENWRTSGLETTLSFQHNNLTRPLTYNSQIVDLLSVRTEATTPTDAVSKTIDNFWTYIKVNDHDVGPVYHANRPRLNTTNNYPLFQPFVGAHCVSYDLEGLESLSSEVLGPSVTHYALQEIQALSSQNQTLDFAWVATNSSSVGAVVGLPFVNFSSSSIQTQQKWWSICDISATWNRTTLHFDPIVSSDIGFELSSDVLDRGGGSIVSVSTDFLDSVNFVRGDATNTTIIHNMWDQYIDETPVKDGSVSLFYFAPAPSNDSAIASLQVSQVVSTTLSVIVADILSTLNNYAPPLLMTFENQTHYTYTDLGTQLGAFEGNFTVPISADNDLVTENHTIRVDFKVTRYGYISGNRSVTMTFAIVVNYLYAVTAVIYLIAFVFALKYLRVRPVKAWGEIEELLVLAFLSRQPPELNGCGAGVDSHQTWEKSVRIRANAENSVEMVFQESPEMYKISPDREYN